MDNNKKHLRPSSASRVMQNIKLDWYLCGSVAVWDVMRLNFWMKIRRTITARGRPILSSGDSSKKLTFPCSIAPPPSHLAPSLLSLLELLAVGVCCCWSNDGGSGMRISNRGCRRRPRWNRYGQRSFPRSALVVTQSFALREAMATRTIRLRSWWCD